MDGLELARRLKSSSADIQVVILSGYRDFAYAKRAISCGVSNYLLKPVDTEEFAGGTQKDQADAGSAPYFHERIYAAGRGREPGIRRFRNPCLY